MTGSLLHFFLDVDMRCNHKGLAEFLKKNKIKFGEKDFIVFMNSRRNMVKMFCNGKKVLLHYRSETRILDPGVIRYLPKYCNGQKLDMDGAVSEHLQDVLRRRKTVNAKAPKGKKK